MSTHVEPPYLAWARAYAGQQPLCLRGSGVPGRPLAPWLGAAESLATAPECWHERAFVAAIALREGAHQAQVFPTLGTSGANAALLALLFERGGELLCERPTYDPLWRTGAAFGARVRFFDRRPQDAWRLDPIALESALTHETRAVIIARPHNPTGADVPAETLVQLGEMAEDHDLHIIVDEVYLPFIDGAVPAFRLHPRLVSTASLTKVFGLGEQRLGWVMGDEGLVERLFARRLDGEALLPSLPFRLALACWSELDPWLAEARQRAAEGSAVLCAALGELPGLRLGLGATPYGFAWWGGDDRAACQQLEARGVGVVPGHLFAARGGIRIGWARSVEDLRRAAPALREVLEQQLFPS
ncbi:MAG: pyridoxal phosphate-dependent aminotransferase [Pseudomonadota bacterium]